MQLRQFGELRIRRMRAGRCVRKRLRLYGLRPRVRIARPDDLGGRTAALIAHTDFPKKGEIFLLVPCFADQRGEHAV